MDKRFDPSAYEQKWQTRWSDAEYFKVEAPSDKPPYCIMIPPPNVTGNLHIGHALQSTIQDLLTRWRRMQGHNALWLPGTDHAGIATQLMVERHLAKEGLDRVEMGREAFLERVWEWKHQHAGNIREQLDKLGASCDWTRERFTLDEGLSEAVAEAFVRLYEEGLIYRAEYLVNWSPGLDTAISDLEVEMKEVDGKLYHVSYPIEGSDERVVVATTRPETMLGDTAIAMHPDDERYRGLEGKVAVLPLVGRELPFVKDDVVEPDFGSGLVKVTPFHDATDFEIGKRHDLPGIQVIDRRGKMTTDAGEDFAGMDRYEARALVVERLEAEGYLVKTERHVHNVGHCQRSGEAIEPRVSTQWFCDVSGMAERALGAVRDGDLRLIPDSWDKTWAHWLENIKPWCISRQLWWGHQIPAWYTADGEIVVARTREEAVAKAGTEELTRDDDVLDTWFSSGLWPFSTLGWPEDSPDLKTFYPTSVLVTGFDILFFWVARMVMTGYHFTDQTPFAAVHLTGLVRDAEGQKMSKTKGNTVDPLDLVDEYGADALRFTLAALDVPGRDIPLDLERMAGYRSFGNKIWNATRFALSKVEGAEVQKDLESSDLAAPERWILSRLASTAESVNDKLEDFRFDEACNLLYHFFWGDLCDWYLELAKPALYGDAPRPRVGEVVLTVLDQSLRLLHPVMPFLTEELWQRLPGREAIHSETITLAPYPEARPEWRDELLEQRMGLFTEVVSKVRNLRAEMNVPPKEAVVLFVECEDDAQREFLQEQAPLFESLGRLETIEWKAPEEGARKDRVAGITLGVQAPERELSDKERARLQSDAEKLRAQIERSSGLLADEQFLAKAPEHVVAGNRQKLEEMKSRLETLEAEIAGA